MKSLFLCMFSGMMATATYSQAILDGYIQQAIAGNEPLQQQQFTLEQSMLALQEAKSLYMPRVALLTDYFLAGGGRTVDFPAGQLLNPVYSTLNQLTGSTRFPTLADESILLNPNNFYDARVRTTMPLLNQDLKYNKSIRQKQVQLQALEIDQYKRALVKDVKTAYYQYLQAVQAVKIYTNALQLLQESHRVNEVLLKNDKVNRTVVLRSRNELVKYEALQAAAIQTALTAQAYFNFLLSQQLDAPIQEDSAYLTMTLPGVDTAGTQRREEFGKLQIATAIQQDLTRSAQAYKVPKVSAFLDLGSQGFDGRFNSKTRYYFLGVSLQWDLFTAGANKLKTAQAKLNEQKVQRQLDYTTRQLYLGTATALHSYRSAVATYQAAQQGLATAQVYYQDMLRQYKQGLVLYIELIDAQNEQVQAQLRMYLALFDAYTRAAELERATANYPIQS